MMRHPFLDFLCLCPILSQIQPPLNSFPPPALAFELPCTGRKMAEAKMPKLIAATIKAEAKPSSVPRGALSGIAKTYCTSTVTSRYESMASAK